MNLWPCILRELQVSARLAGSYWLRVFCGAVAVVVGICTMASEGGGAISTIGLILFGNLSGALGASLGLLMPALLSDSISRERREGTLPLLLLTPLRPFEVVLAKSVAGIIRGLTIILTVLPLLAVSFLMGGLTASDLLRAGLNQLAILFSMVAVGIVASAMTIERRAGIFLALGLAVIVAAIAGPIQWVTLTREWMPFSIDSWREAGFALVAPLIGWATATGAAGIWSEPRISTSPTAIRLAAALVGASGCLVLVAAAWAGWRVSRVGALVPAMGGGHARRSWWTWRRQRVVTPLRPARGQIGRNPTGWVYSRRKSMLAGRRIWIVLVVATLVFVELAEFRPHNFWRNLSRTGAVLLEPVMLLGFGLAGVMFLFRKPLALGRPSRLALALCSFSLPAFILLGMGCNDGDMRMGTSVVLGLLTLVGLAISSGLSWREERESGALELLAVSRLSSGAILFGRWSALVRHALPAFACVFVGYWVGYLFEHHWLDELEVRLGPEERLLTLFLNLGAISAWCMLPAVGMYASLRLRHPLAAILATVFVGVLYPWLFLPILGAVLSLVRESAPALHGLIPEFVNWPEITLLRICGYTGLALQIGVGSLGAWLSHRGLENRTLARN